MKLAILDDYLRVATQLADWSEVARHCEIAVLDRKFESEDDAAAALADVDIVVTIRERTAFPRSLLARLPRLRYIAVTGMRHDSIDVDAAAAQGVLVSNSDVSRGGGGVSELAWGLVLAKARHIACEDASVRRGGWQTRIGFTLRGKTIGIVGLGRIGGRTARYAVAFGMRLLAWSPHLTQERAAACGAECVALDELLRASHVVTLHLPLADSTRGMLGARELALMRAEAILVNTSRAALVDEAALVDALRSGRIAGAGIDVFDAEPPPEHPLRRLDNAVVTPHIGYFTREMMTAYFEDAIEAVLAFLAGRPLRVVNARAPSPRGFAT